MTSPGVTLAVLIPYHNERALLTECLQTLQKGDDLPDEILIYDDASTFPPEPYVPQGMAVRILTGTGASIGPARGRNLLWRATQCEYVHFQDADDLFNPAWCRRTREALSRGIDIVFAESSTFDSRGMRLERLLELVSIPAIGLLRYCLQNPVLSSAGTYRTTLVKAIGGYRESLWQSEDYDFHVRIAAQSARYELITDPLILIRQRDDSRSHNQKEVAASTLQAIELLAGELNKKHLPDLSEAAASTGIRAYRLGLPDLARRAFGVAHRLGRPKYGREWFFYRVIARLLGPMAAERIAARYRKLLSSTLRSRLRAGGEAIGLGSRRKTFY